MGLYVFKPECLHAVMSILVRDALADSTHKCLCWNLLKLGIEWIWYILYNSDSSPLCLCLSTHLMAHFSTQHVFAVPLLFCILKNSCIICSSIMVFLYCDCCCSCLHTLSSTGIATVTVISLHMQDESVTNKVLES